MDEGKRKSYRYGDKVGMQLWMGTDKELVDAHPGFGEARNRIRCFFQVGEG